MDRTALTSPDAGRAVTPANPFIPFEDAALDHSIPDRFERQVASDPTRLAVKSRRQALTCDALNQLANRLARAILAAPGDHGNTGPVALLLPHGISSIAAILAVWKAARFFTPLNPSQPEGVLVDVLRHSEATLLVTDSAHVAQASALVAGAATSPADTGRQPLWVLDLDQLDGSLSGENLGLVIPSDAYAQVLFTSGSLGAPKGVIDIHRNLLHNTRNHTNAMHISAGDRCLVLASSISSFTISTLLPPLLNGAAAFVYNVREQGFAGLAQWMTAEAITLFPCSPTTFRRFAASLSGEALPTLRLLRLTTEKVSKLDVELFKRHTSPDCLLVVEYGSTEATAVCHNWIDHHTEVGEGDPPVGHPAADKEILLFGEDGRRLGLADVGEIAVRSRYLSPGYWRQPELTRDRFLPDPDGSDKRLYLTGDLGHLRSDGALELLGRKDFQVKVRGNRVQTEEVEATLLELAWFAEAAVLARPDQSGQHRLIAYLVPKTPPGPGVRNVRSALEARLPAYMVPSTFIYMDALPRSAHGKVDRQKLPAPSRARPDLGAPVVPPRTPLERQLASVWCDLLELDEIGVHDSFFEVGGDSLSALAMILEVEKLSPHPVPMEYFRQPTIEALVHFCATGRLPAAAAPPANAMPAPSLSAHRPGNRWQRVKAGQISTNAALRWGVRQALLQLPYVQGLRWLSWIGRPTIANVLYAEERRRFDQLLAELGASSAATDDAFRASVLGNVISSCLSIWWRANPTVPVGDMIEKMHVAPARFWRTFAGLVDSAQGVERSRLIGFEGLEQFYRAHKLGRGTILLTYHSPTMDIVNAILARFTGLHNIPTLSQYTAGRLAAAETAALDQPEAGRVSYWTAGLTVGALQRLREGGVVQIVNDTISTGRSVLKPIGQRLYDLPPGFAELALATGATVLPVASGYNSAGSIRLTIAAPLQPPPPGAGRSAWIDQLLDQYVAFVEQRWRALPETVGWDAALRYVSLPQRAP